MTTEREDELKLELATEVATGEATAVILMVMRKDGTSLGFLHGTSGPACELLCLGQAKLGPICDAWLDRAAAKLGIDEHGNRREH